MWRAAKDHQAEMKAKGKSVKTVALREHVEAGRRSAVEVPLVVTSQRVRSVSLTFDPSSLMLPSSFFHMWVPCSKLIFLNKVFVVGVDGVFSQRQYVKENLKRVWVTLTLILSGQTTNVGRRCSSSFHFEPG